MEENREPQNKSCIFSQEISAKASKTYIGEMVL
jgi:hypothetical protein